MIRKDIEGYISSVHATASSVFTSDASNIENPEGQGKDGSTVISNPLYSGRQKGTVYPFVHVLPESQILRIVVTGGSGFVGSHLVDR